MPRNKELRLYGDLIYQHKPTIRTILWKMFLDYFAKKNRHRRSAYIDNRPLQAVVQEQLAMPEMSHFAIVKNNIVEEIIVVNPVVAEVLRFKKIKFVEFSPTSELVYRGMEFKNNEFITEEKDLDNDKEN